jgi:hypothetical protein
MKISPDLLTTLKFSVLLATFTGCHTSTEPQGADPLKNDTLAVAETDSVPGKDTLCLPGCGLESSDTLKTGTIPDDHYECPACGMG